MLLLYLGLIQSTHFKAVELAFDLSAVRKATGAGLSSGLAYAAIDSLGLTDQQPQAAI